MPTLHTRPVGARLLVAALCLIAPGAMAAEGVHTEVNGAGSTFIAPLMNKWSAEFAKAGTQQVYYLSVGSGAGVAQFLSRTVEFATTDTPLTAQQLAGAKAPVLELPLAFGAVTPIYNLHGLSHAIRLTPEVLAGIFMGEITRWNDPKLAAVNPKLELPDLAITVIHRSDPSGTTFALTDYLSKVSPGWKAKLGTANTISWPVGQGAKGNEGVTTAVQATAGSLGYVELAYAMKKRLPMGELKNQSGNFVDPTQDAVAAAAASISGDPEAMRAALTNAASPRAWPISSGTWAVMYKDMPAGANRTALLSFLRWVLDDGQKLCEPMGYAPLPQGLQLSASSQLNQLDHAAH